MLKYLFLFGFMALSILTASGQTQTPVVNSRQSNQTERIKEGVRNGELTRHETRRLVRQQRHIQRSKKVAKADGTVTAGEKAVITHQQNKASRHIARKKNNQRER